MFIKIYLITLLIFFIIDIIWLGLIAKNFYQKYLGFLMTNSINWIVAVIIFYLLFIVGVITFVIYPSLLNNFSLSKVILLGGFFGLVCYATYDLTNLATIKNWPIIITIIDIIWGTILTAIVSLVSFFIAKKIRIMKKL